jgi:hypothetical protein
MTKPTSAATRCDRIISLIDECLAGLDTGLRSLPGEGHPDRPPTAVPSPHLALVRS